MNISTPEALAVYLWCMILITQQIVERAYIVNQVAGVEASSTSAALGVSTSCNIARN